MTALDHYLAEIKAQAWSTVDCREVVVSIQVSKIERLVAMVEASRETLLNYAAERARYEKRSGIATKCAARKCLAELERLAMEAMT